MDDIDKLAVSVYGTDAVAGDVPLAVDAVYGLRMHVAQRLQPRADDVANNERCLPDFAGGEVYVDTFHYLFNGDTWDRLRNNWTTPVLASAARGASVNSDDQVNYDHPHLLLTVDITVRTAAETIQLAVELIDPISGAYSNVWTAAAAVGAVGTYTYLLGPAAVAAVYTENIHIVMPRDWRLVVTQVGVGPITYSVAVSYIHH